MNETKELEAQLRSWALRRPSPRIEKRLARHRPGETPTPVRFGWLAPVTAVLLLACMIVNQHNSPPAGSGVDAPLVAMILSNQSSAAYLPGSFQQDQNIITANTFDWTNGSRFTSSIRSHLGSKGIHR
jgi:hypothetical protein